MAGGGKVRIADRDNTAELARVVAGRLLVSSTGGGGGGGAVDITAVGGVPIGATVPVSGTVAVTQPVSVDDNAGSLTVDGTVAVSNFPVTQPVSGTVAVSNFPATQPVSGTVSVTEPVSVDDNGGSLTVDGTVAVSSVAGNVTVVQPTYTSLKCASSLQLAGVNVSGGNPVPVTGTVSVAFPAAQVVEQATHANLNATVRVKDKDSTDLMSVVGLRDAAVFPLDEGGVIPVFEVTDSPSETGGTWAHGKMNEGGSIYVAITSGTVAVTSVLPGVAGNALGKAEDQLHIDGDVGVMALAVRKDTAASLAGSDNDYQPLITDSIGRLHVNVGNTVTITGAVTNTFLAVGASTIGKAEDAVHASGDVGVMALAVRQDTMAALAGTTGDYIPLTTDSMGRLRIKESGVTTIVLSGSTRGRPIQITGTATGTANTLHTATTTAGQLDRMFIYLTNTSTASVTVTIEFGTTGVGNEMDIVVPANETIVAVNGACIGGAATDTIKAYATTGSVVNAFGRVERLT